MEQGSSSAGGSGRHGSYDQVPVIATIDDAVSLIRSIESAPDDTSTAANNLVPVQIQQVLLPALKRQFHHHKGKGQRLFTHALQGNIDPLSMLDPARNTLGFAYILACRTTQVANREVAQSLIPYIATFAKFFIPAQLIGAGEVVTLLARNIASLGQLLADPIGSMTTLLQIFDGFRSVQGGLNNLSTLHPIVLFQCLRAHHYSTAVEWILNNEVINADESLTPLSYTDVLEYLYYGGLIWARLNVLDKACEVFELCVTSPAQQVSAIQIDAYKKLILLQLLKDGKTSPLPRYTSQAVTRAIRSKLAGVEAYQNIAKAYEAEPSIRLYAADNEKMRRQAYSVQDNLEVEINKGMDTLSKDQNVGLVKRLLGIFVRRRIQRLSRLINRLKVGDIVDLLGGEIEGKTGNEACLGVIAALEQMDADRWLRLTVEEGTGGQGSPAEVIVRFAQHEVDHAGLEAVHRLTRIMQEASWWDKVVEYKQKSVKTSEAYLSKQWNPTTRSAFGAINVDDYDDDAFS